MFDPLRHSLARVGPSFRHLLSCDGLTQLTVMIGQLALPWWIIHAGNTADLATYGVVLAAVVLIGMPLLSPLGDRFAKRNLICGAMGWYAVHAAALAWLAGRSQYHGGWLLALAASQELAFCLYMPAASSIAAELVSSADLPLALNLQKGAESAGRLLGPALAGITLAAWGTAATLWIHAALLVAAMLLALKIPTGQRARDHVRNGWWPELKAGMAPAWRVPVERGWLLVNTVSWLFMYPAISMLVPVKVKALGLSSVWLGTCEAAVSVGMLLGTLGLSQRIVNRVGRFYARVGGGVSMGLTLAVVGFTAHPYVMTLAFFLTGLGSSVTTLVGLTHRTLARPPAFRGRMSSAGFAITQVASTLGPALAGVALLHWAITPVYVVFGLLTAVTSSWLAWVPGFRHMMQLNHIEVDNWYGRNWPHVFAAADPMPAAQRDEHPTPPR
ncbi:MFS transporter [Amantichitinum ursilacus]|uniref:Enterobactin exporter EntS n=1 Tax=Amantichitinum ursilacus TaxID=857265 RepID=A0A0N1JRJ1_9NEIS|nr:MFS transporter [Amantichitinum ursilacus]KPC49288.1 enterobactin exporter EntS [Amantichitinum ursilacus]